MSNEYTCPCCGEAVGEDHFVCKFASKGGTAGRGKSKARSLEHTRAAAAARWAKYRARKKVIVPIGSEPLIEPESEIIGEGGV